MQGVIVLAPCSSQNEQNCMTIVLKVEELWQPSSTEKHRRQFDPLPPPYAC